jgi:hypothetical protein
MAGGHGRLHDLGEFMKSAAGFEQRGWHGFAADSAVSGVLVRLIDDETVQTGFAVS